MNTETTTKSAICFSTSCETANVIHFAVQNSRQSNELRKKGIYLTVSDFAKIGLMKLKSTSPTEMENLVEVARDDKSFRKALQSMVSDRRR